MNKSLEQYLECFCLNWLTLGHLKLFWHSHGWSRCVSCSVTNPVRESYLHVGRSLRPGMGRRMKPKPQHNCGASVAWNSTSRTITPPRPRPATHFDVSIHSVGVTSTSYDRLPEHSRRQAHPATSCLSTTLHSSCPRAIVTEH